MNTSFCNSPSQLLIIKFIALFTILYCYGQTPQNSNLIIDEGVYHSEFFKKQLTPSAFQNELYLVSHGKPGALLINGEWKHAESLVSFLSNKVNGISALNILGCNFAQGEIGKKAVAYIEKQLNIPVYASTNISGEGGDWVLEVGNRDLENEFNGYEYSLQCPGGTVGGTALTDDFDGDGVCNELDIDDDNDGTLDHIESPNCFYTAEELSTVTAVYSDMVWRSANPYTNATDGDVATFTQANSNNQSMNNKTVIEFDLLDSFIVQQLDLEMGAYRISYNTSSFVKLQGWDGTQWVDMSPNIYASVVNGIESFPNTLAPTTEFSKLRLFGTGNMQLARIEESFVTLGATNSSEYPKATCTDDYDQDGFPNHMDLDTDGDTCYDIFEANVPGSTTSSTTLAGPFGANGLDDSVETSVDSGEINYASTYNSYALSLGLATCLDSDGDGIFDIEDIDDDNDGVPDHIESPSCFYTAEELAIPIGISTDIAYNANDDVLDLLDHSANATFNFLNVQSTGGNTIFFLEYPAPIVIDQLEFIMANTVSFLNSGNNTSSTNTTVVLQGSNDNASWTDLSGNIFYDRIATGNMEVFQVTQNSAPYKYYRIYGVSPTGTTYSGGTINRIDAILNGTINSSLYPKPECSEDVDTDGLVNHLDPDSDGDGCNDSVEAGVPGASQSSNTVSGPYGTNGLADNLETSADSGEINYSEHYSYAILASSNYCFDTDGDGVPDLVDLDDDNDGVTDLEEGLCIAAGTWYTTDNYVESVSWTGAYCSRPNQFPCIGFPTVFADGVLTNSIDPFKPTGSNDNDFFSTPIIVTYNYSVPVFFDKLVVANDYGVVGDGIKDIEIKFYDQDDNYMGSEVMVMQNTSSVVYYDLSQIYTGVKKVELFIFSTFPGGGTSGNEMQLSEFSVYTENGDCVDLDTDGDGIPNRLDLDSDDDGCPDIIEASVDPLTEQTNAAATNTQGGSWGIVDPTGAQLDTNGVDADGNGINDSVDSDGDGNTDYAGTYFAATSDSTNFCLDTDGDGIKDIDDIDDDNDGIVDAEESPDCYYTEADFTAQSQLQVSSDFTFNNSFPIERAIDDNSSTFSQINPLNQAMTNMTIVEYTLPAPLDIADLTLQAAYISSNTSSEFKLQGWDGTQWVDMSAPMANTGTAASNMIVLTNTLASGTAFSKIRVYGISGTLKYGRIYDTTINLNNFQASLYPNGECTDDVDGDGIPNHLDLDSDDDGCPDAIEGSDPNIDVSYLISQTDMSLDGGYDADGLPLVMNGTGQEIGSSQDALTFDALCNPPYCDDPSLTAWNCDFDGDGILNKDDIDDDNDGVLDIEECGNHMNFSNFNQYVIDESFDNGDVNFTLDSTANGIVTDPGTNVDTGETVDLISININSSAYVNATFTFSNPVINFQTSFYDIDGAEELVIEAYYNGSPYPIGADEYTYGPRVQDNGNMTFTKASGFGDSSGFVIDNDYRLDLDIKGPITQLVIKMKETNASGRNFGIENPEFCFEGLDTDGDGIPNMFDLDSDGDECPDAKEASVNGVLISGDVINGDGTTNTTTTTENSVAEGPYGDNGHADSTGTDDTRFSGLQYTSTYTPFAIDPNISNCNCYKPGSGVASITKVGISTLNRFKNADVTHWPEDESSAYLALDSREKGFVITRLSETKILGLDAVEGMLVYDTTNDCLKMYDGVEWFCLVQTCDE